MAGGVGALNISEVRNRGGGLASSRHTETEEANVGLKTSGHDRIWGLAIADLFLSFITWGFQGSRPLMTLAAITVVLFILNLAVPSKYQPHSITSIVLLMAGVLVGVSLEKLLGSVPYMWWAVCAWPAIAVAVGLLRPLPFLKRTLPLLKMTAATDAEKEGGRKKWKKYRPYVISILVLGMSDAVGVGIAYMFSLYGPDVYGSREMFKILGPLEYTLIFWITSALCVMHVGPFKAYAQKNREAEEE